VDFSDALRAARDGRRVRRALWLDSWLRGSWVELVPAHPLPDGRTVAEMLLVGHGGGEPLRQFGGTSYDLAEAQDWEVIPG
jgi:hypothetical protein